MTATLERRTPTAAPAPASSGPPPPGSELTVFAELALTGVTAAAALGFGRLFTDGSFFPPVALAVVLSHALAAACRRGRISTTVAVLLSFAGLAAFVIWGIEPHTTTYGVPGSHTWHAIGHDIDRAWQGFVEVAAPAPVTRGFIVVSAIGFWLAGFAADAAAFRVGAPLEALIPSFTLFVFGSVLGADRHRLAVALVYLGALLLFLLLQAVAIESSRLTWFGGESRAGVAAVVRGGLVLVVVALIGAAFARAPVSTRPVFAPPKSGQGPTSRVTISPLVDIKTRLVQQRDVQLFTVHSDALAYWRLTALDKFDGQIWSSEGTYKSASHSLPNGVRSHMPTHRATEDFAITALSSIWLPAAYRPATLEGAKGARFDEESSSLLAKTDTSDGLRYRVQSELPATADSVPQLANLQPEVPAALARRYLNLPDNFPARVAALASQVTRGAATPYLKAKALQDWLKTNYTYDENVDPGHDENAMERFLFRTRRGYCEQFAGTYAAMARSIGLPTRVGVGFIPGESAGESQYIVKGGHAHAWPEVYFDGFGWVSFEPTPGRGPNAVTTPRTTPTVPPTVVPTSVPQAGVNATTTVVPPQSAQQHNKSHFPWKAVAWILGPILAVAAALGLILFGRRRRWARRRAAATTPAARVLVAWDELGELLTLAGHHRRAWETPAEYAHRLDRDGVNGHGLVSLAGWTSAAVFAAEGVAADVVPRAESAANAVRDAMLQRAGRWRRLRWLLDPRPLLPARLRSRALSRD